MRRLVQMTLISMGLLLSLTTALLQTHRDGEVPPSVILNIGEGGVSHLELLLPFTQRRIPLTPELVNIHALGWTPNGFVYTAQALEGDRTLYRLADLHSQPELLANKLWPQAVLSPDKTWVVVMSSYVSTDHYGLSAIRTDGRQRYALLTDASTVRQASYMVGPLVSPGGRWVAFGLQSTDGAIDVYRVRYDGTGLENLTLATENLAEPLAWVGDGEGLVIAFNGQPYYLDLETKHRVPLLTDLPSGSDAPTWVTQDSTAGVGIFRSKHGLDTTLYGVRFDGSLLWAHPFQYNLSFAPNGAWGLVLEESGWVRLRGSDGAGYSIFPPRTLLFRWESASWSPDGNAAFLIGSSVDGDEIWRFEADSGHFTRLWHQASFIYIYHATLSPDGKWLILGAERPFGNDLGLMHSDGSDFTWITDGLELGGYGFGGWGPPIDKNWSAGLLLAIGIACLFIGIGASTK